MKTREENGQLVADEAIYATKDGKLVGEGDPDANELVAAAGRPIRQKDAERYGLKGGKAEEPKAQPTETKDAEHVVGEGHGAAASQTKKKIT